MFELSRLDVIVKGIQEMRALVTGAAGFIGSTLVDRLLAEGHQVIGIDNLSRGSRFNLLGADRANEYRAGRFTFFRGDIQDPELTGFVVGSSPDVVFHLAAQVDLRASVADPLWDARANVLGTINVLEACRRAAVPRIVYAASGGSRYGIPRTLPVTESEPLQPISPYAAAKLAGELYVHAHGEMHGAVTISLALANVYGPRQNPRGEAGVVAVFGSAMITGHPVTLYGDGTSTRDYVYVDDVVDAFLRASLAPTETNGTYNIGTGDQTSLSELHRLVADAAGVESEPLHVPARTGELRAIALDAARAGQDLGWKPTVGIAEGVGRTVDWLRTSLTCEPTSLVGA